MASLLYGLAGKLAGELCSPLFKDYVGKPCELGTKSEFEKLKNTVSAIEAVLLDAEEKQRTNRQVQDWLIKIKLVFYDLEDLLQEVRTEDLRRQVKTKNKKAKKVHVFFSRSNQLKYRFKMGHKVKLIRERLDAIASDRNSFNFTERREETHLVRIKPREDTHWFVPIHQFVGRDADKDCVTKHLLQYDVVNNNVSVVSIVGIGGMGKTTLAQSVYDSEEVKHVFDLRLWVCVSDPFDVKVICENIIMSATHKKCERLPMAVVIEKLKSSIDGRKYLLVLDDVWNDKQMEWEKLEVLLIGGARGSKILITTRAKLVARASNSIATHVLKGLSHDDSWALFKQVAFKRGVEHVSQLTVSIGKEIIEKCVGVPLVIKAIGSMLAVKEREIDWLNFKKNDLPRVAQHSEGTVLPILKLSFDYLPTPLKRCFVYCAIYPEDHEFEKEELIGMWVAHGLIQLDSTTRSLEDVGERYFMDLLDRSFFEVHERAFEKRTCYKMHDLIHDLAQSVGGDDYYDPGSGADYIVKSTRHAWVSGDELTNICHDGEKLRTLALTEPCNEQKVNELTITYEKLRVLRLRNLRLTSVPIFVGGLRHLYYLDLSWNSFVSLLESICSLYNLQTLILCGCHYLEELPAGTRYLVNLRLLDVSRCIGLRYMPRGVEELTCLQTLNEFVAGGKREEVGKRKCAEVSELKSLVNLRGSLAITDLRGSQCERNESCILMELNLVKQLKLNWRPWWVDVEEEVEEEEEEELLLIESLKPHPNLERLIIKHYWGSKYPSWMDRVNIGVSLPNIVYIKLVDCWSWGHVAALGLLPSLQQLLLDGVWSVEYLIDRSSVEEEADQLLLFPSLKGLTLGYMRKLKSVVEPTEASQTAATNNSRYFPVLEKLEIFECPLLDSWSNEDGKLFVSLLELHLFRLRIETLPSWVQYVPHLQTLKLSMCDGIASLPEWMQHLTSLQRLVIAGCPKLKSRCEKETGVDWNKIAHIQTSRYHI